MSCRCDNDRRQHDRKLMASLAKKTAVLTGETQVLYEKEDGSFAFSAEGCEIKGEILEYITKY